MTLKDKAKTYNFWISIVSAAVLIARIIGDKFNFFIDTTLIMDITTGLCSIFVILGILSAPKAVVNNIQEIAKTQDKTEPQSIKDNGSLTQENVSNTILTTEENSPTLHEEEFLVLQNSEENQIEANHTENNFSETKEETLNQSKAPIDILKDINDPKINTVLEVIESLKAEIHKANKTVEEFTKFNN